MTIKTHSLLKLMYVAVLLNRLFFSYRCWGRKPILFIYNPLNQLGVSFIMYYWHCDCKKHWCCSWGDSLVFEEERWLPMNLYKVLHSLWFWFCFPSSSRSGDCFETSEMLLSLICRENSVFEFLLYFNRLGAQPCKWSKSSVLVTLFSKPS